MLTRMLTTGAVLLLAVAACGEEELPPPPPAMPAAAAPAPAAAKPRPPGTPVKSLGSRMKAEDKVVCPLPAKVPQGTKTCDATSRLCEPPAAGEPKTYCLTHTDNQHYCLPCAERDAIRHVFTERDFALDQTTRDPFISFVIAQKGLMPAGGGDATLPREITKDCTEKNMVASNFGFQDLRLVGIVAERAQRRVLMMDPGNLGHIIKKNDCVGREKAIVKDIGAGYVTFQIKPDELLPNGQPKPVEEHSVQLYPNQLVLTSQPRVEESSKPAAPVVAPPGAGGPPVEGSPQ